MKLYLVTFACHQPNFHRRDCSSAKAETHRTRRLPRHNRPRSIDDAAAPNAFVRSSPNVRVPRRERLGAGARPAVRDPRRVRVAMDVSARHLRESKLRIGGSDVGAVAEGRARAAGALARLRQRVHTDVPRDEGVDMDRRLPLRWDASRVDRAVLRRRGRD